MLSTIEKVEYDCGRSTENSMADILNKGVEVAEKRMALNGVLLDGNGSLID